jgi:ketosteroid isomerase-like protein
MAAGFMRRRLAVAQLAASAVLCAACTATGDIRGNQTHDHLRAQVMAAERGFAATMAKRDHAAFAAFLADEAVFFADATPLRGKAAVTAAWRPLFESADAPFSWEPDSVEVLESGTLALSSGPVRDPAGNIVARFNTVWRRDATGRWQVVFDKGTPVCAPAAPKPAP